MNNEDWNDNKTERNKMVQNLDIGAPESESNTSSKREVDWNCAETACETMSVAKRARTENFSKSEKLLILKLIKENASILEKKSGDPKSLKKKNEAWVEISEQLQSEGYTREPKKIREFYFRMKHLAKSRITLHRKETKRAGGEGPSSAPDVCDLDWMVYDICPDDFERDESELDRDTNIKESTENEVKQQSSKKKQKSAPELECQNCQFHWDQIKGKIENERHVKEKEILEYKKQFIIKKMELETKVKEKEIELLDILIKKFGSTK